MQETITAEKQFAVLDDFDDGFKRCVVQWMDIEHFGGKAGRPVELQLHFQCRTDPIPSGQIDSHIDIMRQNQLLTPLEIEHRAVQIGKADLRLRL